MIYVVKSFVESPLGKLGLQHIKRYRGFSYGGPSNKVYHLTLAIANYIHIPYCVLLTKNDKTRVMEPINPPIHRKNS